MTATERSRKWRAANLERARQHNRNCMRRIRADPERRAQEYLREKLRRCLAADHQEPTC